MATVGYGVKYHCHSNNKNNNNNNNISTRKKRRLLISSVLTFAVWSFLTLTNNNNVAVQSAAVYSNVDFLANPIFEPLCALQQERFIESEGKESSLILEFNAKDVNEKTTKSCKRILSAPSAYGFIVRLILPKIRHQHHQPHHVQAQQHPQKQRQPQKQQAAMKTLVAGGGHASDVTLNGAKLSGKNKMATVAALSEMTSLFEKLNGTATQQLKTSSPLGRACPLSVFSSHDPHTPQWRVDPCQLEDTAPEMEDPVRLFHGRLRIVWEHGHQELDSKLMVTVLGKGDECRSDTKHQCLKIGDEPILCISKDLVCDGIRHCPNSNEYDSDEDYAMCWQRRRFGEPMPVVGSEIFEHFALEVFRNLFAFDVPGGVVKAGTEAEATTTTTQAAGDVEAAAAAKSTTTLRKVNTKQMTGENSVEKEANEGDNNSVNKGEREDEKDGDSSSGSDSDASNSTATQGTQSSLDNSTSTHRRNSTRLGLNSDLSKYGPWGYLMLGMLLCGGALLICGLWASATQHAANNERESNLQHGSGAANSSISNEHTSNGAPPNYEELDPPPSYAALFPNQKAASSTTLNSLSTATAAALAVATVAATATAIASVPSEGVNRTTTPVTQVQLESQASGSTSRGAPNHPTS